MFPLIPIGAAALGAVAVIGALGSSGDDNSNASAPPAQSQAEAPSPSVVPVSALPNYGVNRFVV